MQKKIIAARVSENITELTVLLQNYNQKELHSSQEIDTVLKSMEKLYRSLSVEQYISENSEISNELNVHLKIMETVSKQEEIKKEIEPIPVTDTVIEEPKQEPIAEVKEEIKTPEIEVKTEPAVVDVKKEEAPVAKETQTERKVKKLEIGINDKFRMINELFGQSQLEYSTAIEQLNLCNSLEEAEIYLNNLAGLYSWKADAPLVKTIYTFNQKRFS